MIKGKSEISTIARGKLFCPQELDEKASQIFTKGT